MLPQRIEREEIEVDVDLADLDDPAPRRPRVYRLRDAALLLACFAATLLLLDADGLHAWVTRMEVGPAQDFWAALVEPWRRVTAQARLDAPRRLALGAADQLAARLSGGSTTEDLLARGWTPEPVPAPATPAPPDEAAAPAPGAAPPVIPPAPADAGRPAAAPAPRATAATAATATATATTPSPPPPPGAAGAPVPVLLLGDSLMVTLAPSILRAFDGDAAVKMIVADRSATGLSRPDVYDWPSVAASFVETHRPRLAICAFGGNDAQDVRAPDGKVLRFGSDAWDALYAERVHAIMALLQASGTEVLWLGLPPMRGRAFDERMRHLNELYAQEASSTSGVVTYEQTARLVGDPEGRFAEYLRSPRGKLVRIRARDGIHYADDGARLVAVRIKDWVHDRLASRTAAAAAPPPATP
jgi:hypothetical protein